DDKFITTDYLQQCLPEHVEPEQKKRGFLSRFFLPYG
ncbi:plasmid replication DNA-binding protein, partial [Acinetobacter baumannii]|nr:DNA-binding protein [Acinetobacter baumannii]EKW8126235.1 DNA-binding protein [Acinetobacter baumannii]EKW9615897.1 DNA-binding protein [Acinetobacter baumannii]